jgi:hypothetical protein
MIGGKKRKKKEKGRKEESEKNKSISPNNGIGNIFCILPPLLIYIIFFCYFHLPHIPLMLFCKTKRAFLVLL